MKHDMERNTPKSQVSVRGRRDFASVFCIMISGSKNGRIIFMSVCMIGNLNLRTDKHEKRSDLYNKSANFEGLKNYSGGI